jgi:pyruvate dehydrogenase E1 component
MAKTLSDADPIETEEWLEALASVIECEGVERAQFLLEQLLQNASKSGVSIGTSSALTTPYCNTIPVSEEPAYPGDTKIEYLLEAIHRWNAIVMVLRAKKTAGGVGGHLSSYASIATAYEVGFNHFFRGATKGTPGDLIYFQGHSSEGNYARAFLEGRLSEQHLLNFRQEVHGNGVSSYPHPWLMPAFWQFATVSLGLGPLQGIYQARFLKYLENRKLLPVSDRKVWIFTGDGEMDEPESIAGLTMAVRENLDNVIYVVNCNLQRLDGPVRSHGKIIQELEGVFRGAGWNVIKVIWSHHWDPLFAKDKKGVLLNRLNQVLDGGLQSSYVSSGKLRREFLCANDTDLQEILQTLNDEEMELLSRGGHELEKIYAAYAKASQHKDQPTAILLHTVKGYGLGKGGAEGRNIAHNQLDMTDEQLKAFCTRFNLPLSDEQIREHAFYKPSDDSPEMQYLLARRKALNGFLPERLAISQPLLTPSLKAFDAILEGSKDRTMSTTMVLGRIFNVLLKDENIKDRLVPIFSDEVRTFGLEELFRKIGIYSHVGQLYVPEDKEQLLYYRESEDGQLLEEGITEAGCMASWIAAATSYSTHQIPMIPIFVFYSMFGFQRVGDFIWAAGDMRARGFLIGATAGRTTLEGEGLQHQDGQSLLMAGTVPNCRSYDPAFGYEMAVIMQHGLDAMFAKEEDVFYYIMSMNERYVQPAMPEGVEEGIVKGLYLFKENKKANVQLLGSGAILNEVIAAAALLEEDFGISANIWSATSFNELRREASMLEREARFSPTKKLPLSYLEKCLQDQNGPVIAATDYVRAYAEQIRPWIKTSYTVLGTDGYGRSDTRARLREFFEVNRYYIVLATLHTLAKDGTIPMSEVTKAIKKYKMDPKKPNPMTA